MAFKGSTPSKKTIDLYGITGEFKTPNNDTTIRFFSTYASNKEPGSGEADLLMELKPMREQVPSSGIEDLSTLLQRDLDDSRVANALVPYLKGLSNSNLAFFPAILAVLIPQNFIVSENGSYPKATRFIDPNTKNVKSSYEGHWILEQYADPNDTSKITPMGMLSINPTSTNVVVIDGQHRANAFRYVTGMFDKENSNQIYSSFYQNSDTIKDYDSDLPVTLIWFEKRSTEIEPKFISRRLFVDVNNSARKVSTSRTILLNDFEISSLCTRFLYSGIAQKSKFSTAEFSLLHSGFDMDSDLSRSSLNAFTLTTPEIIHYVFSWLLLGSRTYNSLDMTLVKQERFKGDLLRFSDFFEFNKASRKDGIDDGKQVVIDDPQDNIPEFNKEFSEKLMEPVLRVFEEFSLFKKFYEATDKITTEYFKQMVGPEVDVWNKVFLGGEGLYYTFKNASQNDALRTERVTRYSKAINDIEDRVKEYQRSMFHPSFSSKVGLAYKAVKTKAFQVALFMALDDHKSKFEKDLNAASIDYVKQLNSISVENWVFVLTDFKDKVFNGVDPKKWPTYHKIILRIIQDDEDNPSFQSNNFLLSPDGIIYKKIIKTKLNSWDELQDRELRDTSRSDIDPLAINEWLREAEREMLALVMGAGLDPIDGVNYETVGKRIIDDELEKT